MKKLLFFLLCYLFIPRLAFAQTSWTIDEFHADILVQASGEVSVSETIHVDFGNLEKHGIYRDLPVIYTDGGNEVYTQISVLRVLQDSQEVQTKIESQGDFLRIRIGDPDETISGKHSYRINYLATGVLQSFTEHDELYWNVTGNDWEATIEQASATVTLPRPGLQNTRCFQGYTGSDAECESSRKSDTVATFSSTTPLSSGDGMTIVAGWEKGLVPILRVEKPKSFPDLLAEPLSLLFLFTSLLIGVTAMILLWFKRGRDMWWGMLPAALTSQKIEKEKPLLASHAVVVEYTPPEKLRPAEIGVLTDDRADTLDVVSSIIDLATRGYLTITEIPKKWLFGEIDYELSRKKKSDDTLLSYEKVLLNGLFAKGDTVTLSSLKRTFYDELKEVKKKLYQNVVSKKFFPKNPEKVRQSYYLLGVAVAVIGGICIFAGYKLSSGPLGAFGIGGFPSALLILLMARTMPRRTAEGYAMLQRIKGYRLFIATAEKHRQKFFEQKNLFNEVLPYAIMFGLTEKFAKAMKDIGLPMKQTTWYHGTTTFHAATFGTRMDTFSRSLSSAIAAAPKSSGFSGGGSSGSGFGGGGGGSW